MRAPAPRPTQKTLRERLGMTGAFNSCVGYGCLGIALLFVVAAVSAWCSSGHPT